MKLPYRADDPDLLLRRALQANAAFSTACAALFLLGGAAVGEWFGRPAAMTEEGLGLMVFAALVFTLSLRPQIPAALGWLVVALDVLWVANTGGAIAAGTFSPTGSWTMGMICLIVLDFAALQALGIFQARKQRAGTAGEIGKG